MKESKNHLVLSLRQKKKQQPTIVLWFGLFGCFLEAIFIFIVKDMTFTNGVSAFDQFSEACSDLVWCLSNLLHLCSSHFTSLDYLFLPGCELTFAASNVFCISGILGGVVLLLVFDNQLQVASFHTFSY